MTVDIKIIQSKCGVNTGAARMSRRLIAASSAIGNSHSADVQSAHWSRGVWCVGGP